jgi:hypothetical protein
MSGELLKILLLRGWVNSGAEPLPYTSGVPLLSASAPTLGPCSVIFPGRALHALPGDAPHTEVAHRRAVGPPEDPGGRVGGIQAVARGQPLCVSFPSAQGASTHSFSPMGRGRGKEKGGTPAPASVTGAA